MNPACPGCGHRLSLHGIYLRDPWCIGWDGLSQTFCGCQQHEEPEPDPDDAYDRRRDRLAEDYDR